MVRKVVEKEELLLHSQQEGKDAVATGCALMACSCKSYVVSVISFSNMNSNAYACHYTEWL